MDKLNLGSFSSFINNKKFLLILFLSILTGFGYKYFIKSEISNYTKTKIEMETQKNMNYTSKIKALEGKATQSLNELRVKTAEKEALNKIGKDGTKIEIKSSVPVSSVNLLYYFGELGSKLNVKVSNYKYTENQGVDMYVYGNYQDLLIFFDTMRTLTPIIKTSKFSLDGILVNKKTGTPSANYETVAKSYKWADGNTTDIAKQMPIFAFEDGQALKLKAIEDAKLKASNEAKASISDAIDSIIKTTIDSDSTKMDTGLLSLISKYSKSADEIQSIIKSTALAYNVPISYAMAVAEQESGFSSTSSGYNDNGTSDKGVMQINSSTAPELAKLLGLTYDAGMEWYTPLNIDMGVSYLKGIMAVNSDPTFVFTAYNRGIGGANSLKESTGSFESDYSKSVKANLGKYKQLDSLSLTDMKKTDYSQDLKVFLNELKAVETKGTTLASTPVVAPTIIPMAPPEVAPVVPPVPMPSLTPVSPRTETVSPRTGTEVVAPATPVKAVVTNEDLVQKIGIKVSLTLPATGFLFNTDTAFTFENLFVSKVDPFQIEGKADLKLFTGNPSSKMTSVQRKAFDDKLNSNLVYRTAEINATKTIIQNRRKLGLNIDAYLAYLNYLLTKSFLN